MMNKKFTKLMKGCALAMALAMTTVSISAYAAETPATPTPASGSVTKVDPTAEGYAGTEIDVYGYTKNTIVYSVDVEWGAMTFEYEASKWDPVNHKKIDGGGWKVYDESQGKALEATQDTINRVTVKNHSNAPVYAKMSFEGTGDYLSGTGTFTAIDNDDSTDAGTANVKAEWKETDTDKYLALQTAATDASGGAVTGDVAGTPSVGNVYFKPTSDVAAGTDIAKWTKIGTINVAVQTDDPAATPVVP